MSNRFEKTKREVLATYVKASIKEAIDEIARRNNTTASAVAAAILEHDIEVLAVAEELEEQKNAEVDEAQ